MSETRFRYFHDIAWENNVRPKLLHLCAEAERKERAAPPVMLTAAEVALLVDTISSLWPFNRSGESAELLQRIHSELERCEKLIYRNGSRRQRHVYDDWLRDRLYGKSVGAAE